MAFLAIKPHQVSKEYPCVCVGVYVDASACVCVIGHVYPVLFVGVISNDCQYPPASGRHEDYLSTGPMCRYAEDLLPMLRIMAGPNAHKYTTDRKPGT